MFFFSYNISLQCGMNVTLMQHLSVITISKETNEEHFLAIDLDLDMITVLIVALASLQQRHAQTRTFDFNRAMLRIIYIPYYFNTK